MSHTLTGLLRVVNTCAGSDFVQKMEEVIRDLGADALAHITVAQNNGMFIYYDVYLDGSVTVATTVEDFIEGLQDLDDVDAVMWVDTSNRFGEYEFAFSYQSRGVSLLMTTDFLNNIQNKIAAKLHSVRVASSHWKDRTEPLTVKEYTILTLVNKQRQVENLSFIDPTMVQFEDDGVNPQFAQPIDPRNAFPYKITMRFYTSKVGYCLSTVYYRSSTDLVPSEVHAE